MGLNHAMTNTEARPHLIKAYKDMRSPAFDQHVYTDKEDYRALRWVIKKGINLQGFRLERAGEKRSGVILAGLMGWDAGQEEQERKLDIAKYYVTRGKMQDLDEAVDDDSSSEEGGEGEEGREKAQVSTHCSVPVHMSQIKSNRINICHSLSQYLRAVFRS